MVRYLSCAPFGKIRIFVKVECIFDSTCSTISVINIKKRRKSNFEEKIEKILNKNSLHIRMLLFLRVDYIALRGIDHVLKYFCSIRISVSEA